MIGRTLQHYTITAELGNGSFGRVYLALDKRTGRKVALKFLDPTSCDVQAPGRLAREAMAASKLSHPGIVALYGLEEAAGEWFLVEEFVEGKTLALRLAGGPLGGSEMLRLARELASALAHAHAHGVLHRDLAPANILIAADGTYKIADFGLARIEGGSSSSDSGSALGTLPYTAPERIRGNRGDARADLFSLGAVLYEALTGQRAFAGTTYAEILYAVMNVNPPRPWVTSPQLERIADLVPRLLAKEPGDRPASAQLVVELLDEALRHRAGEVGPRVWRHKAWIAILIAVSALIGVLAWLDFRHPPEGTIAVLPFENVVDPGDTEHLGVIASSFLVTTLAQAPDVSVLSTERVLEVMNGIDAAGGSVDRAMARTVARRTGAPWIIRGSILRLEPTLLVTGELSDATHDRVMNAAQVEGTPEQTIFTVIGLLGARLVPKLPRIGPRAEWKQPHRRGTKDLEAYGYYVEGLEQSARGDLARAELAYARALERDPKFDWARDRLAFIQWLKSGPGEREVP